MRSALRVRLLGTGGAANECRYQSSLLIEPSAPDDALLLLDTGNGMDVVRQLLRAGCDPTRARDIFVSHRHVDHMGGLEPLLLWSLLQRLRREGELQRDETRVYAEPRVLAAIEQLFTSIATIVPRLLADCLRWVPLVDGQPVELADGTRLVPFLVEHLPADGGAMGCLVERKGTRLVYSGDSQPCQRLTAAARGVDVLFHEVGGLDASAAFVHLTGHSTAGDAGRTAQVAGARRLVLTHLPDDAQAGPLLAEAGQYYDGPIELAADLELVEVTAPA